MYNSKLHIKCSLLLSHFGQTQFPSRPGNQGDPERWKSDLGEQTEMTSLPAAVMGRLTPNMQMAQTYKSMKTFVHFLGVSPEDPSRNKTGFYFLNSVWPLGSTKITMSYPEQHLGCSFPQLQLSSAHLAAHPEHLKTPAGS